MSKCYLYNEEKRSGSVQNFTFYNPTKLIFGSGQVEQLKQQLVPFNNILVVYGGGSIKRNGLYDEVMNILNEMGKTIFELAGVEPNPRLTTVRKGVDICKTEQVDFLLAVGGGSVLDCTKAIAAGAKFEGDAWEFITNPALVKDALPFGTILTLAATGSEMNCGSVITNWETNVKQGWGNPLVFPKFSILDPKNTISVPKDQTIYGIVDMMSHVFEQYFHQTKNTPLQDQMCEAVLRTVIEAGPELVNDLENYELRETILYCGTIALNGILAMGVRGDWASHNIEHAVSAVYDIPHGGGLAILFPNWMKHVLKENPTKFVQLAVRVFAVETTGKTEQEIGLEGIEKLITFWKEIGAPTHLTDYKIDDANIELMADKTMIYGEFGNFKKLNREDVIAILQTSL